MSDSGEGQLPLGFEGGRSVDSPRPPRVPLAERMRPLKLSEVVGQSALMGEGALLPRLIERNRFGSLLFYGPPGCGKTTLARVTAQTCGGEFVAVNAVLTTLPELRQQIQMIRRNPGRDVILFIDEIHQFNRSQQDILLPDLERGTFRLIGATTKNPGFYLIPPLLSRSHLFKLEPIESGEVVGALQRAVEDEVRGFGKLKLTVESGVFEGIAALAGGDLRRAYNVLETLVEGLEVEQREVTREDLAQFGAVRTGHYDAREDDHYDIASAFIKSIRGGDPDASLYWLVRMLEGGEDPRFVARRLVILASEDVGLADARALPLATAAFQACEWVGQPECELNLAHVTLFLATAPKSNSATMGLASARKALSDSGPQRVPLWLKDSHTRLNRQMGQGKDYLYSHDFPEAISGQDYLETPLNLYQPIASGSEKLVAERLALWQGLKAKLQRKRGSSTDSKD